MPLTWGVMRRGRPRLLLGEIDAGEGLENGRRIEDGGQFLHSKRSGAVLVPSASATASKGSFVRGA